MAWDIVLLTAFGMAAFGGIFGLLEGSFSWSPSGYDLANAVTLFIVGFCVNALVFAYSPPTFHAGGWQGWLLLNMLIILISSWVYDAAEENNISRSNYRRRNAYSDVNIPDPGLAVWLSGLIIVGTIIVAIFYGGWFLNQLGQDNATKLADTVHEEKPVPGQQFDYPATDPDHIPIRHEAAAREKANRLVESSDLGTRYNLNPKGQLQALRGRLVYLFTLDVDGLWTGNRYGFKAPNYVIVDAEDPNANAQFSDPYDIAYLPDGYFGTNLERHVYAQPGMKNMFIDDLSFEADDTGHPFYTASLDKSVVRWEHSVPVKFITVDAVSGEVKTYDLNNIPSWVDRVYSSETVKEMLNWWGEWGAGPQRAPYQYIMRTYSDRYKVAGEPNLVYTNTGAAWQVLMKKFNASDDQKGVQKIVLMDTRTNNIRVYDMDGAQTEQAMYDMFDAVQSNTSHLVPAQAAIYRIYGANVWVGGLIRKDSIDEGTATINASATDSYAGVGIVNAVTGTTQSAILGTQGKAWALNELSKQLSAASQNVDPSQERAQKEVTGTVVSNKPLTDAGTQRAIIKLLGQDPKIHYGKVVTLSDKGTLDALDAEPGDTVIIDYGDDSTDYREASSVRIVAKRGSAPVPSATTSR